MFFLRNPFRKDHGPQGFSFGPCHTATGQQRNWINFDPRNTELSWTLFADKPANKCHGPDGGSDSGNTEDEQYESEDTQTESEDNQIDSEDGQLEGGNQATSEDGLVSSGNHQSEAEGQVKGEDDQIDNGNDHSDGHTQAESEDEQTDGGCQQPDRDNHVGSEGYRSEHGQTQGDRKHDAEGRTDTQNKSKIYWSEDNVQAEGQFEQGNSDDKQPGNDNQDKCTDDYIDSNGPRFEGEDVPAKCKDGQGRSSRTQTRSETFNQPEGERTQTEIKPYQGEGVEICDTHTATRKEALLLTQGERLLLRWRSVGLGIEEIAVAWNAATGKRCSISIIQGKLAIAVKKSEGFSSPFQAVNDISGVNHEQGSPNSSASTGELLGQRRNAISNGENGGVTDNENDNEQPQDERSEDNQAEVDRDQGGPTSKQAERNDTEAGSEDEQGEGNQADIDHTDVRSQNYDCVSRDDHQIRWGHPQDATEDVLARQDGAEVDNEDDQEKASGSKMITPEPEKLLPWQTGVEAGREDAEETDKNVGEATQGAYEAGKEDVEESVESIKDASTNSDNADEGYFITRHVWTSRLHLKHLNAISDTKSQDKWDPSVPSFHWEHPFSNALFEHYSIAVAYPDYSTSATKDITPRYFEPFNAVDRDFTRLRRVLELFEPKIVGKWVEMPRPDRLDLLKKCWPIMFRSSDYEVSWPEQYNPDYQIGDPEAEEEADEKKEEAGGKEVNKEVRNTEAAGSDGKEEGHDQQMRAEKASLSARFRFPMISSDLKEGHNFLQLLKSRGRHEPAYFEFRDVEALNRARSWRCLGDDYFYDETVQDGWAITWAQRDRSSIFEKRIDFHG